jgi:peptidoglycan/LPS O-acetylase OafA/YrhL
VFIPSRAIRDRDQVWARQQAKGAVVGYQPQLDGLRALAVGAVVAYHAALPLSVGGYAGVDVFFVLSGYLITSLLLRERSRAWSHRISLGAFYLRRARRLLPALAVMLAVTFVAYHVLVPNAPATHQTLLGVPASVFYIANWLPALGITNLGYLGHMWSLSVEEHFYLLWPMVLGFVWSRSARRTARRIAVLCCLAAVYRALLVAHGAGTNRVYAGTDARAEELLVGCLLAAAIAAGYPRVIATRRRLSAALVAGAVAVLGAVMAALPVHSPWLPRGGSTLIELAAAVVITHLVLFPASPGARLLAWRPVVWIGRRSYGIYLWHLPLMGLAAARIPVSTRLERIGVLALVGAATLVCAALSYRFVERPFLRIRSEPEARAAIDLRHRDDQDPDEQSVPAQSLARAV